MVGSDFATVDEAAAALAQSVEQAASRFGRARQQEVVQSCVLPMSERMRTEGAQALAQGRRWSSDCEGLHVRMHPVERECDPTP
ncbi:hypothetical protein [Streptomyces hygroscopicus]|uniref:hypothetical protein n=1 Tax=Streptomyces hygroscopicus TaxID=1912 RepID=UPI00223FBA03|nr:hypothetical protein [Streptomyces hygroscopicus]